jgi:signal transduction histidine kinase
VKELEPFALGAYAQVWTGETSDDEPALGEEKEAVLASVARAAATHGFEVARQARDAVLLIQAPGDLAVKASVEALRVIFEKIVRRPGRHPSLRLGLCVKRGTSGELADWRPAPAVAGFTGPPDLLAGLRAQPTGVDGLVRVPILADGSKPTTPIDPLASHTRTMAQIGALLAGIVHELRSPLSVVKGNVDMALRALESGHVGADEVSGLRDALAGAHRIVQLASEILAMSSLSAHATRAPVRLDEVVESAVLLAHGEVKHKAAVNVARDGECWVDGSRTRLIQVVVNLLVNAAQAIEGFGRIDVRIVRAGAAVRLEVEDDGPGMDDDVRRRAFDRFFTTKQAGQGTGLGLALVREVVEEHGGFVDLESRPGAGTRFVLEFPAA